MDETMKISSRLLSVSLTLLMLAGCASTPKVSVKRESDYYKLADGALRAGNYTVAITNLESLESQYPVGRYTEQAQLEVIYAKHMQADHIGAVAAADRYIRLHPDSTQLDYVLYLRGLSNYAVDQDSLLKRLPVDNAHRDIGSQRTAFDDFRQLILRYPDSPYTTDARQRMVYIRNQLAESELNAARYYETRGATLSVINRARWVVENYPESAAVPEALTLLVRSYRRLNMSDLAEQTERLRVEAAKPATGDALPSPTAPPAA